MPSGNLTWLNKCKLWWVIHLESINGSFPLCKKSTRWKKKTHDPTFAKSAKSLPHRWAHSAPSSVYCGTWPRAHRWFTDIQHGHFTAMAAMSAYQKVCRKIGKSNPKKNSNHWWCNHNLKDVQSKCFVNPSFLAGFLTGWNIFMKSRVKVGTLKAP